MTDTMKERDTSKPAEQQGLFRKFDIRRTDGSDQPGGKHYGCRYFVLDMTHDAHAPAALRAYAESCKDTHPQLAADLVAEFGAAPAQTAPQPFRWISQHDAAWLNRFADVGAASIPLLNKGGGKRVALYLETPAQTAPSEPDWTNSQTLPSELWKNPLIPMNERLEIADGAVRFRDSVIANLRMRLAAE